MALTSNLKRGSKGENVKKVQAFLGITVDGDYGPNTEAAVRTYQTENNLRIDGIVGPETWGAMGFDQEQTVELKSKPLTVVNNKSDSTPPLLSGPITFTPEKITPSSKKDPVASKTVKFQVNTTKAKNRLKAALNLLKIRAIDEVAQAIESKIPIPLPFAIRPILEESFKKDGRIDTQFLDSDNQLKPIEDIVTLQYILSLPPEGLNKIRALPESRRIQALKDVESIEENLNFLISSKNTLYGGVSVITSTISTLGNITNVTNTAIEVASKGITAIKIASLAIPTSPVPITAGVITSLSEGIKSLGDLLKENEAKLSPNEDTIKSIQKTLQEVIKEFDQFNPYIVKTFSIIAFLKAYLKYPNITQQEIDDEKQKITLKLQESLSNTPGPSISTSNDVVNKEVDRILVAQLDPNSNDPLFYKGFRLTIQFDPNNTFSFPARRIQGENDRGVKLYSIPPDTGTGDVNTSSTYSFSSSTQVLINEVKFNIDQYLVTNPQEIAQTIDTGGVTGVVTQPTSSTAGTSGTSGTVGTSSTNGYLPFGTPGTIDGQVRFKGGKAWRYLGGNQDRWVEHTISYTPFISKGTDGEIKYYENQSNSTKDKFKWNQALYKWVFQSRTTLTKGKTF